MVLTRGNLRVMNSWVNAWNVTLFAHILAVCNNLTVAPKQCQVHVSKGSLHVAYALPLSVALQTVRGSDARRRANRSPFPWAPSS
eukprot:2429142-Pyramimonas_sp.AAC.1